MKKTRIIFFNFCISIIAASILFSCSVMEEEPTAEQIDMTIDIGGSKSEMASFGFSIEPESSNPRALSVPFLGGTLVKAYSLEIYIPNYIKGKSTYLSEKKEVEITYEGGLTATDGATTLEWKSEKGTVEITNFTAGTIEGKLNATLSTPTMKNKVLELKNGVFKVSQF